MKISQAVIVEMEGKLRQICLFPWGLPVPLISYGMFAYLGNIMRHRNSDRQIVLVLSLIKGKWAHLEMPLFPRNIGKPRITA